MASGLDRVQMDKKTETSITSGTVNTLEGLETAPYDIAVIDSDSISESFTEIVKKVMEVRNEKKSEKGIILAIRDIKKLDGMTSEQADALFHSAGGDAFVFEEDGVRVRNRIDLAIQMVRERLRRAPKHGRPDKERDGNQVWRTRHLIVLGGNELSMLTPKEFVILDTLISSSADTVSHDVLRSVIGTDKGDNSLEAVRKQVQNINEKIRSLGYEIKNVRSEGYFLSKR